MKNCVPGKVTKLRVTGLDCSSCALKIEKALSIRNISHSFDPLSAILTVREKDVSEVTRIIKKTNPSVKIDTTDNHSISEFDKEKETKRKVVLVVLSSVLLFVSIMLGWISSPTLSFVGSSMLILSYLIAGLPVLVKTWKNLLARKLFDENSLMTIATISAIIIGKTVEAVAVMLLYAVGELLQHTAANSSKKAIKNLINELPEFGNLLVDGKELRIHVGEISIGNKLIVKTGERVPVDGTVEEGRAMLDMSSLTGESIPVEVEKGNEVLSGSINKNGVLIIVAKRRASDSAFQRVVDLTASASKKKSKTELTLRRFAEVYTPLVVFLAAAVALVPPLFMGAPLLEWTYRALVLLVISCPCAMLISVPLTYFSGIGALSKIGVLMKDVHVLEAAAKVSTVVFDKTGTLTSGLLKVKSISSFNGYDDAEIIHMATLLAKNSNHPVANAIKEMHSQELEENQVSDFQEFPGFGIVGKIGERHVVLGNATHLERLGVACNIRSSDSTTAYLAIDSEIAAVINLSDSIREDARGAIDTLRRIGIDEIIMLTGDKKPVAENVAEQIGVDRVFAEVLPEGKLTVVEKLHRRRHNSDERRVMFVGDGINDAPSIVRSDVGVAMGGLGSDAATEAADVVIADDSPSKAAIVIVHARKTRRIVLQNILFTIGAKAVFLVLGSIGIATMWQAVFADVGVTLIAILNAFRAFKLNDHSN